MSDDEYTTMDALTAVKEVIKSASENKALALGVDESVLAVETGRARLCIQVSKPTPLLARSEPQRTYSGRDCRASHRADDTGRSEPEEPAFEPDRARASCAQHGVALIIIEDAIELGKWAGLIDAEGKAAACQCMVVTTDFEPHFTPAFAVLQQGCPKDSAKTK